MKILKHQSLQPFHTFGLDIYADELIEISDPDEIPEVLQHVQSSASELLVLGGGSNILFTGNCLERLQGDKKPFIQQAETYEHFGDVETYVMDMHVRYDEMKR